MQVNKHKASRIRKEDHCVLILSKPGVPAILSVHSRSEIVNDLDDYIKHPNVVKIWEGKQFIIVGYRTKEES